MLPWVGALEGSKVGRKREKPGWRSRVPQGGEEEGEGMRTKFNFSYASSTLSGKDSE